MVSSVHSLGGAPQILHHFKISPLSSFCVGLQLLGVVLFRLKFYLCIYFWLQWVRVAVRRLSGAQASVVAALRLQAQARELWPMDEWLRGMWDLSRSGLESVSPALAGGFFPTEPLGKPQVILFYGRSLFAGRLRWWWCLVSRSCPTLLHPMDCSLPGFSVHGILQARILEWVVISFSGASSQPRTRTQVSCIAGRFFTN